MSDAESFVEGMSFEEAAKHGDDGLRDRFDEVPWRDMAGMRDVIVHGYSAVNLAVVWNTVHRDFPAVKPLLRQLLARLESERE